MKSNVVRERRIVFTGARTNVEARGGVSERDGERATSGGRRGTHKLSHNMLIFFSATNSFGMVPLIALPLILLECERRTIW